MRSGSDAPTGADGPRSIPLHAADEAGIAAAVQALGDGRLVLHPTATLVSLSGDPHSPVAVAAAREIKGYARPRPFLCLVADSAAARTLAGDWPAAARRLADAFWPGPLTLVVEAGAEAPRPVRDAGRIALRPVDDPVSRALVEGRDGPIFSTSANRRGEPPSTDVERARVALVTAPGAAAIALALAGGPATEAADRPSTIVDVTGDPPRIVRVGSLAADDLRTAVPDLAGPRSNESGCRPRPPGGA